MYERFGKRLLDVVAAGSALLVLSPLLLLTTVLIWLEDRRSPIFRQPRLGRDQVPFTILKFRSMKAGTPDAASADADSLVVTGVGRVLRRTNLDEVPQLLNIVRGEMSIVGPRPALKSQTELISVRSAGTSFAVRPGLTGLAQIRAYDDMPESEKGAYDNEYAARVTFAGDAAIIAKTVRYLMKPPPRY